MEYRGANVDTFLHECEDLLRQVEETVLEQRAGGASEADIHGLFRAFHSIKGAAGLVGFDHVASFTHSVENVLDRVRHGDLDLSGPLSDIILASKDHIVALIAATLSSDPLPPQAALLSQLQAYEKRKAESLRAPARRNPFHRYAIRLAPQRAFGTSDFNLPAVLTELQQLGRMTVTLDASAVPALEDLDEGRCYLAFDCHLIADCDEQTVRDTFLFAPADAELRITQQPELGFAVFSTAPPPHVAHGPQQPAITKEKNQRAQVNDAVVRVSSQKLDRLVALVGELVINQSRLSGVADRIRDAELAEPVEQIQRLVVELRESVLGVRMMPIGSTFGRFKRLVHDLSAQLGKQVSLVTEGAETELDKTVLDRLVEPLVHLIRNSLDHGIEPADARAHAGKPVQGCIRLSAAHVGQQVIVKLSDDGRGLDAAAIRHKAIERGLISADQTLPAAELFKLIFLPGFPRPNK
jgi:two-component system chemotaxis sensor kinase CheA